MAIASRFPSQETVGRHDRRSGPLENLTAVEVARLQNVGRTTVLHWYRKGIVPASFHVGNVIRFDLAQVREALARHSRGE